MNPQILAWPCWYFCLALLWSLYQGFRGAVEQDWWNDLRKESGTKLDGWKRVIILYVHDFAYRGVCTLAGFCSLYACYAIAFSLHDWKEMPAATGTLLAGSFIVGVIGVGGQLHNVLLLGGKLGSPAKGGE